jgi:hypothetical protein
MRKVDGWQTLATKPIDLAASACTERAFSNRASQSVLGITEVGCPMTTRIRIVDAIDARGMKIVACDLLNGELASGMKFVSLSDGGQWEVRGMTLPSPELYQQGRRAIMMIALSDEKQLREGDEFVAE